MYKLKTSGEKVIFGIFCLGILALILLLSLLGRGLTMGYTLEEIGYANIFYPIAISSLLAYFLVKHAYLRPKWLKEKPTIIILQIEKNLSAFLGLMFACMLIMDLVLKNINAATLIIEFFTFAGLLIFTFFMEKIFIPIIKVEILRKKAQKSPLLRY